MFSTSKIKVFVKEYKFQSTLLNGTFYWKIIEIVKKSTFCLKNKAINNNVYYILSNSVCKRTYFSKYFLLKC